MTDALLNLIPECANKSLFLARDYDIASYLTGAFADEVAYVNRICKEELLCQELATIEQKKQALAERFARKLQGFVDIFVDGGCTRTFKNTLNLIADKKERDVDALVLRAFIGELRRKSYVVFVTYEWETQVQSPEHRLWQIISIHG